MPFEFKPYDPPKLSNLRERLLKEKARTVEIEQARVEKLLQDQLSTGPVSRSSIAVNQQYLEQIKGMSQFLRDGLETVKRQNDAERKTESDLRKLSPLQRESKARGFYRSSNERNAAILGILERERRLSAPLTREAWSRAQAIAASRRFYDPETSQLRGSRGSPYSPSAYDIDLAKAGFDPCVEAKAVRREVMFAQGTAGKGYRVRHRRRPC